MNAKKFKQIIYLISVTVIITVAIQVYRNVQNYQINKKRFVLDMQQVLDLSVESYYASLTKRNVIFTSIPNEPVQFNSKVNFWSGYFDSISGMAKSTHKQPAVEALDYAMRRIDSLRESDFFTSSEILFDSLVRNNTKSISSISILNNINYVDSLNNYDGLLRKVISSLTNSTIDFDTINAYLTEELRRKNLKVSYELWHYTSDTIFKSNHYDRYDLSAFSNSTFLPKNEQLEIKFENASLVILKRGMLDLLISLLITGVVMGSLLYLYKVITEQKELAEIKNDLISNITHEFKTPIATISTAIEGISNFNKEKDPEKTAKYLNISSLQLKRLNNMVEKLLETASIDSDDLDLSLEATDVVIFTREIFRRFNLMKGPKELSFQTSLVNELKELDTFHMENVISNLIDNALKYGGDKIRISLEKIDEKLIWKVMDNGNKLDKTQQARIFDKFYRVPTGNLHDVKGFGIGLYYAKKIIEKHKGLIEVDVSNAFTTFTIKF